MITYASGGFIYEMIGILGSMVNCNLIDYIF